MTYESGIIIFEKVSDMPGSLYALLSDSEALLRFTDSVVVDANACPHPQTAFFTWISVLHHGHTSIAFAINRAKYQTLHSRKTPSFRRQRARHVFLRVTKVDCTRMRIGKRGHVRQNGRPNVLVYYTVDIPFSDAN